MASRCLWTAISALASVVIATAASGCGQSDGLLTTADVRRAFAHEGFSLVVDVDKAPWIHFLWYGADGGNRERMAIFVFDEKEGPADARIWAKQVKGGANVSRILIAENVAVILLPLATADERRRALDAVTVLRRE